MLATERQLQQHAFNADNPKLGSNQSRVFFGGRVPLSPLPSRQLFEQHTQKKLVKFVTCRNIPTDYPTPQKRPKGLHYNTNEGRATRVSTECPT